MSKFSETLLKLSQAKTPSQQKTELGPNQARLLRAFPSHSLEPGIKIKFELLLKMIPENDIPNFIEMVGKTCDNYRAILENEQTPES
jgi:hypothetical protein